MDSSESALDRGTGHRRPAGNAATVRLMRRITPANPTPFYHSFIKDSRYTTDSCVHVFRYVPLAERFETECCLLQLFHVMGSCFASQGAQPAPLPERVREVQPSSRDDLLVPG